MDPILSFKNDRHAVVKPFSKRCSCDISTPSLPFVNVWGWTGRLGAKAVPRRWKCFTFTDALGFSPLEFKIQAVCIFFVLGENCSWVDSHLVYRNRRAAALLASVAGGAVRLRFRKNKITLTKSSIYFQAVFTCSQ